MYLYTQATFELHKKFYNLNMSWYKLSQFKSDLIDTDRELYIALIGSMFEFSGLANRFWI